MSLVVIVDDRITNRNIFAKLANSIEESVEVRTFRDPCEALDWLADNPSDLIISDYKMPQLDGAEFIRRLRLLPSSVEVPVVVITVYEERNFRLRALEAGATDFLHSPVDHHEFVTRARNLLKMHRQQKELAKRAVVLAQELESSEKSRQLALRDSSERMAQVIDTLPAMISASAPDGSLLFVNASQLEFAGIDPARNKNPASIAAMFGDEQHAHDRTLDALVFQSGEALPGFEQELVGAKGLRRIFATTKAPLRDASGEIAGVLTSSIDISQRKKMEAHLRHLAHHDQLTNLPNRILLAERLRALVARARRGDQLFALHLIDLDGFKRINDMLGHTAGDRFLRDIADKLRSDMRESDLIARLGGDEFAILQAEVGRSEEAAQFAQRILEVVSSCTPAEDHTLFTTTSIGTAIHPIDGVDGEELLKNADMAMYRAKKEGGNLFCFYAADMQSRAREEATLDAELRQALAEDRFLLYYQPQVDLATGLIVGAEALLRWRRPGHGVVTPGMFLARTEETGLIVPINEWVLQTACREARSWQGLAGRAINISVNLSPIQFQKRTVPLLVARILAEEGLDPRLLDLELTESIVMHDIDAVATDLRQLQNLGVRVSIDDFGVGYSSLSYVKRFPINRIKIDQCFVRNLDHDPNDLAIVRAIVTLARSLNLSVVAEGVETAAQLERVRAEGCSEVQGYYFGRPMPATDFRKLILDSPMLLKTA